MKAIIFSIFLGFIGAKANGLTRTSPQPPKAEDNHLERTDLSVEVPDPVEKYRYQVNGTHSGIEFHPVEVPLWNFSSGRFQTGALAVGSELQLKFIRSIGGRNFFGFDREASLGTGTIREIVWIDGRFVRIAGQN